MRLARLADDLCALPLVVEGYELEGLRHDVSTGFTRRTTVIHLHGEARKGSART